jgi:hypothetical protein
MADITYNEMIVKWMGVGEQLSPDEVTFVLRENVEPGFNDHSSKSVLEAYRAGFATAQRQEVQRNGF